MTQEEFQQEAGRLRPRLLQVAQGYLHNVADSEDAVQTVLERLWQMVDNVRKPMDGLALVLLRHHCVDVVRQKIPTQSALRRTDASLPLLRLRRTWRQECHHPCLYGG